MKKILFVLFIFLGSCAKQNESKIESNKTIYMQIEAVHQDSQIISSQIIVFKN